MRLIRSRSGGRRLGSFALDSFFFLWLGYALASGNLIPPPIAELINPSDPVVAATPLGAPYDDQHIYEVRPVA
jgi:hypothetical protein